jgi:hypothetical protein
MADGKHYRGVISQRKAVTEAILHETAERHGAAAMGILPLGAPGWMSFAMAIAAVYGNGSAKPFPAGRLDSEDADATALA